MSTTIGGAWPFIPFASTPKQWRHNRFGRFDLHQRKVREWICFRQIAECVAEEYQRLGFPYVVSYNKALLDLRGGTEAGLFDENGRTQVLYLNPDSDSPKVRMSRQRMFTMRFGVVRSTGDLAMGARMSAETLRDEHLPLCWMPRRMFAEWAAKYGLPRSPAWLTPAQAPEPPAPVEPTPPSIVKDEKAAVTELAKKFREDSELTRGAAYTWCVAKGLKISKRGFLQRVWASARVAAGLPPVAPPGRKKSKR
jgi:hypothetical protein